MKVAHTGGYREVTFRPPLTPQSAESRRIFTRQHPGPDLARVDRDTTAAGKCLDCGRNFRSFEASTKHAAKDQHVVQVTAKHTFDVTPRTRQEHQQ